MYDNPLFANFWTSWSVSIGHQTNNDGSIKPKTNGNSNFGKKINCISRLTLIHSVHITIVCPTNHPVLLGNFGERFHEIFSKNYINVWFMSYSKCWNSRRTWNLCFLFNFQLKKKSDRKEYKSLLLRFEPSSLLS